MEAIAAVDGLDIMFFGPGDLGRRLASDVFFAGGVIWPRGCTCHVAASY